MVAGIAEVTIVTPPVELDPDGVPLFPPTNSVALIDGDGAQLACIQMGSGETQRPQYTISNNAIGRVSVSGVSYTADNCTGLASAPSENTAYYYFGPPLPPVLSE
jgi:hypothetical protein